MRDTNKGRFTPKNPHKYLGDVRSIWYRSNWELEFFKWVDTTNTIIGWNSEEIVIEYYNVVDKQIHRYFPDLFVRIVRNKKIVPTLIEIKPEQFSKMPVRGKKQSQKTHIENLQRYYQNGSKWLAAKEYCQKRNWEFLLICKDVNTNSFDVKNNLMEQAILDVKNVING